MDGFCDIKMSRAIYLCGKLNFPKYINMYILFAHHIKCEFARFMV